MKITNWFELFTSITAFFIIGGIIMRVIKVVLHTSTAYKHIRNFDEKKFLDMTKLMTSHGQSKTTHGIGLRNVCTLVTLRPVNTDEIEDRMRRALMNACPITYSGARYLEPELEFTFRFGKISNLHITEVAASFRNKFGKSEAEKIISLN